jgi:hypothetical protein
VSGKLADNTKQKEPHQMPVKDTDTIHPKYEDEFTTEELVFLSRYLTARMGHMTNLDGYALNKALTDYVQFLGLEYSFVSTVLQSKLDGGDNGCED